jgi:phosphatidate phosphatase LPIN
LLKLMVDVMLDAWGYKSTAEDTRLFDALAREIYREETGHQGGLQNLDNLIGHDEAGNLWIYASEEAKIYAESRSQSQSNTPIVPGSPATRPIEPPIGRPPLKALTQVVTDGEDGRISRAESEPVIPTQSKDEGFSYAKTLRLTSEQLVCRSTMGLTTEIIELETWKK